MDKKSGNAPLKETSPEIFHILPKISVSQRQLIIQMAQKIDPTLPAEEVVKNFARVEVSSLWHLTKAEAYKVLYALQLVVQWMV